MRWPEGGHSYEVSLRTQSPIQHLFLGVLGFRYCSPTGPHVGPVAEQQVPRAIDMGSELFRRYIGQYYQHQSYRRRLASELGAAPVAQGDRFRGLPQRADRVTERCVGRQCSESWMARERVVERGARHARLELGLVGCSAICVWFPSIAPAL